MIGKKLGFIVFYDDITGMQRVRNVTVYSSGGRSEDKATLRIYVGKKKYNICYVSSFFHKFKELDPDWQRLYQYIKQNAPNINIQAYSDYSPTFVDNSQPKDD